MSVTPAPSSYPPRLIGFLTYDGVQGHRPESSDPDEIPDWDDKKVLIQQFQRVNMDIEYLNWEDYTSEDKLSFDWKSKFSALVVRSTWDYHLKSKLPKFFDLMRRIDSSGVPLMNSLKILEFNSNKKYLKELEQIGIPLLPTIFLTRGEGEIADHDFRHRIFSLIESDSRFSNATEFVLKPAISAGAMKTQLFTRSSSDAEFDLSCYLSADLLLLQPKAEEIQTFGELSFLYFGGKFQFAARKCPKSGDFRVQSQYGGNSEYFDAPQWMIDQSGEILKKSIQHVYRDCPDENSYEMPLYARVDTVNRSGQLLLMELELLEPSLYWAVLSHNKEMKQQATKNFTNALLESLEKNKE